jgi:hypothetical protein
MSDSVEELGVPMAICDDCGEWTVDCPDCYDFIPGLKK